MNQHQQLAIQALNALKGDDTARAKRAFSQLTLKEMQEQYGQSGKTRAQILTEYEAYDDRVNAAIAWVESK